MNPEQMRRQLSADKVTREVLDLAGMTVEQLCEVNAVSDKQRDFANNVKIQAVANAWQEGIKSEYHNPKFAKALILAVLDHKEARYWCDKANALSFGAMYHLKDNFKKHLAEVTE